MKYLQRALLGAFFVCGFADVASAGFVVSCPDAVLSPGPFAAIGDGASCGQTIIPGVETLTINVGPGGIIPDAPMLESFVGLSAGELNAPFALSSVNVVGGAGVLFPSFTSNPGDALAFDWDGLFESGASGALFYVLDNVLNVLDLHVVETVNMETNTVSTDLLALTQSVIQPLSPGNHTLAFGVVAAGPMTIEVCLPGQICRPAPEDILDPMLTISNLSVGPTAVPEPGTVALFGLGLLGLGALRRKRS